VGFIAFIGIDADLKQHDLLKEDGGRQLHNKSGTIHESSALDI